MVDKGVPHQPSVWSAVLIPCSVSVYFIAICLVLVLHVLVMVWQVWC